jgi:hypothetical protein
LIYKIIRHRFVGSGYPLSINFAKIFRNSLL